MKQITIYFLAIATNVASCSSCKKNTPATDDNPYGLPNATQTGANVFACRINGKNVVSYYNLYNTKATLISGDTMVILGTNKISNIVYQDIVFAFLNPRTSVQYSSAQSTCIAKY